MPIILPLQQAQALGTTNVLPMSVYMPATYIVPIQIVGSAFLSSIVYKSGAGALAVNYFQTTVEDTTYERTDVKSHKTLSLPQISADQLLFANVHNKLYAEIIISGGPVECGIIGTCIDQSVTSGTVNGTVSQSGLNIGGRITEVELVDTEWRPIPAIPLEDRNSIQIQNFSGKDVKINYTADHGSSFGVFIRDSTERMYMIKDTIIIYGRSSRNAAKIIVEEIA
jgi:hypothetical protein